MRGVNPHSSGFTQAVLFIVSGFRALRRDWRSGELRLLLMALIVAISAVTSVGFLSERVSAALNRTTAQMLGGDLVLRADSPIDLPVLEEAQRLGLQYSRGMQFSSMVSTASTMQLVSIKAVDDAYPLRGSLQIHNGEISAAGAPPQGSLWVDAQLPALLGVKAGDTLRLGDAGFVIRGLIENEPDRSVQFINMAPRVLMRYDEVDRTGLLGFGSRVHYYLSVAGSASAVDAFREWLLPRLDRGERVEQPGSARPEIRQALARAQNFLTLVALLTVLVAAVAVGLAARRFNQRHVDGFAVMRCLGISQRQLTAQLLVEFIALSLIAALIGTLAGYAVQALLVYAASEWLDVVLPAASTAPAQHGVATSILLLIGFVLPPVAALRKVAPGRVLRRDPETGIQLGRMAAYLPGLLAFFVLILWVSDDLRLTVLLCAGFLTGTLLFAAVGWLLVGMAGYFGRRLSGNPGLRFALAGISRRRGLTVVQICALAVGLMIVLLLGITRSDLLAGWRHTLPEHAPNTFLINIQPEQRSQVVQYLQDHGLSSAALAPMVRGRLVAINEQAVDGKDYDDQRARRLVEREFNLSYLDQLPDSNRITQGRWLDVRAHEVSLEEDVAQSLQVGLGDTLTFEVAGQPVTLTVTSLREVKWDSFDVNFFAIISPAALQQAPATYITSFYLPPDQAKTMQGLLREVPNVTVVDVSAILGQLQSILGQAIQAVQLLFLFTVTAGVLVLGAAFVSTRDERIREVAILRVLGARAAQVRGVLILELVLIGALAGVMAAGVAVGVSWSLAHWVFAFPYVPSWWPWAVGMAGGALSACIGGGLALRGVLRTPPLLSLREAL